MKLYRFAKTVGTLGNEEVRVVFTMASRRCRFTT